MAFMTLAAYLLLNNTNTTPLYFSNISVQSMTLESSHSAVKHYSPSEALVTPGKCKWFSWVWKEKKFESMNSVWLWRRWQRIAFRQLGCEVGSGAQCSHTTQAKWNRADVKGTAVLFCLRSWLSLAIHASWLPTDLSWSVHSDKY